MLTKIDVVVCFSKSDMSSFLTWIIVIMCNFSGKTGTSLWKNYDYLIRGHFLVARSVFITKMKLIIQVNDSTETGDVFHRNALTTVQCSHQKEQNTHNITITANYYHLVNVNTSKQVKKGKFFYLRLQMFLK